MQIAQYYHYGPMMDGWDGRYSWIGLLFGVLFLVLLILLIYYAIHTLSSHHRPTSTSYREPLDIARERYAKGDITKDEFAEIKKELT